MTVCLISVPHCAARGWSVPGEVPPPLLPHYGRSHYRMGIRASGAPVRNEFLPFPFLHDMVRNCERIQLMSIRLGDTIDDFCVKCKRLTNHHVVSIVEDAAAKVRCCSCYHDHDYRHEQPEPKKPTKKQLEEQDRKTRVAGIDADEDVGEEADDDAEDDDVEVNEDAFAAEEEEERPAPRRGRR